MLVKDPADHKWKVMDYLWNQEQTDAVKHITGAKIPITLLDDEGNKISTVYQVPNTNDCKRCHVSSGILYADRAKSTQPEFCCNRRLGKPVAALGQASVVLPACLH